MFEGLFHKKDDADGTKDDEKECCESCSPERCPKKYTGEKTISINERGEVITEKETKEIREDRSIEK